jgi:hypothetical protein
LEKLKEQIQKILKKQPKSLNIEDQQGKLRMKSSVLVTIEKRQHQEEEGKEYKNEI